MAVKSSRKAYESWSTTPGHVRARFLYSIARHIQKHHRLIAVLESMDNGKPVRETRDCDVPVVARWFYYYAGWAQVCNMSHICLLFRPPTADNPDMSDVASWLRRRCAAGAHLVLLVALLLGTFRLCCSLGRYKPTRSDSVKIKNNLKDSDLALLSELSRSPRRWQWATRW